MVRAMETMVDIASERAQFRLAVGLLMACAANVALVWTFF
jgi:hypothetical protein